jgi:hypothetical protein
MGIRWRRTKTSSQRPTLFQVRTKDFLFFLPISLLKLRFIFSITENPNYLPAIFSLCVMGLLQDDETLTIAALQELSKVPTNVACKLSVTIVM